MTAPGPTQRHSAYSVGDRRGLTAAGGVLLALAFGLAGALADVATGNGLREVFAVAFVTGCVATALVVHAEDLRAAVVMPPLLYVVCAFVAGAVERTSASGSFLTQQVIELGNALVLGAPVLVGGTLAALLVAAVRWTTGRR